MPQFLPTEWSVTFPAGLARAVVLKTTKPQNFPKMEKF